MDLGGGSMTSAGGMDGWMGKLGAADGSHQWSRVLGGSGDQAINGVAAGSANRMLAAGGFQSSIDAGAPVGVLNSTGGWDALLLELDGSTGAPLWATVATGSGDSWAEAVATDPQGNAVVVGPFTGALSWGSANYTAVAGTDGFVTKLAGADGAVSWMVAFGDLNVDEPYDVAIDAAGDVYVVGTFDEPQDIAGLHVIDQRDNDGFVVKLDGGTGSGIWVRTFGGSGWIEANAVAIDDAGRVLVAGTFAGDVDLGSGPVAAAGSDDVFLVALDSADATPLWSKTYGDSASQEADDVAVMADGTVLLSLGLEGSVSFAGFTVYSVGSDDMFLGALDSDGGELWARRFGDGSDQDLRVIRPAADGAIFIAGDCGGHIDFGDGLHSASDSDDVCVARLAP